ncbi:MAG: D-hexose-6-phosphate mutarotase [Verrucomicrobiae bacterium]
MQNNPTLEKLQRLAIPGRVEIVNGHGGLPLIKITTPWSTAEIYLHGAHVAGFQKNGEPPLIFMSAKSFFTTGKPIRGGVPICFPWFGNRDGEPSHGFARITEWELVNTAAAPDGTVTLTLALPGISGNSKWNSLRTEFVVTVADKLTMELTTTGESCDGALEIENCLHTYFQVGDIGAVTVTGLEAAPFDDFAFGAGGARRAADATALRITQETNRVYPDNAATVEIIDEKLQRKIRVEKYNSNSTVVWNPWTTQKMPEDWGTNEHLNMVCVESGNVKQNKILLAPGNLAALKVVLSSAPLK